MQATSETWRSLWAAGARLEARASVNGTALDLKSDPVITRGLTQDGLSVGNAVSAMCRLSVSTQADIPKAAAILVQMRLTNGATSSEWLPAGTFYISRRQKDPVTGVLALECYDALLKANAEMSVDGMPWTTGDGDFVAADGGDVIWFGGVVYPRPMTDVLRDIAALMGVELDSRTQINTGAAFQVPTPLEGSTLRDVLGFIAAAHGGNWVITPENKLRLVPVASASDAASAAQDAVDVAAILARMDTSPPGTVTGIRYQSDDGAVVVGDETGIVVEANVGAALASELYDALAGTAYQPFSLSGAVYDPAVELGDYVRAGANGEIASVLFGETATLGALFTGAISAPQPSETADEYPYIGGASSKALSEARAYAREAVGTLDESLDQESVFSRLTNNGAAQGIYMEDGQLYINMSYARSGTLILGGLNNRNGLLEIRDARDQQIGKWDKDGISLSKGDIDLDSTSLIKIGFNAAGTDYASFSSGGMVIQLRSSSTVRTGDIMFHNHPNYPEATFGALMLEYGDIDFGKWQLSLAPGYLKASYAESTSGEIKLLFDLGSLTVTNTFTGHSFTFDTTTGALSVTGAVSSGSGASGTFTTADNKTVTVVNGIITGIS